MPDATELFALADLKTLLKITDSSQDALLTIIKNALEKFAKQYTGRDLLIPSTAYTEFYDGDASRALRVRQRPITTITSIHADPARLFDAASLIPASDIIDDDRSKEIGWIELYSFKFLKGTKAIKVIYKAGYATVPSDLSYALMLIAAKEYKVITKQMFAEQQQEVGDMRITLSVDTYPKNAMEILKRYRRVDF